MIIRTYVVQMPAGSGSNQPVDIIVEGYPGTQDDPISIANGTAPSGWNANGNAAYYELLGRPLRLPNALDNGASQYVPRFHLGWNLTVTLMSNSAVPVPPPPSVQYSASLIQNLTSGDAGPSVTVPTFADPTYGPSIRLTNGSGGDGGQVYLVTLMVVEPKDIDRTPTGV